MMRLHTIRYIFYGFCTVLLVFLCFRPSQAQEEEKDYDITLVKTAEIGEDVLEVDDKKVLTETVTIRNGEWVWKILREKGLLRKENLNELLVVLQKLNRSLKDLELVHPGEKIVIPLKIAPIGAKVASEIVPPEEISSIDDLKDVNFENYTVRPDDCLIRVAKGRDDIPADDEYREYLELIKKLNPSLKDVNKIYPGQVIKLPIYSPETVRKPIVEAAVSPEPEDRPEIEDLDQKPNPVGHDLGMIFLEMGEEWVQTGEHFIPLKSGGQIDLKAKSFPIINLQNGLRVVVDLNNRLPEKMGGVIGANWGNYRVVHILEDDDLRTAFDRIIRVCDYPKVFKRDESLELQGDFELRIKGDWIITLSETQSDKSPRVAVVNLKEKGMQSNPRVIKDYLESLGVRIIDYPPGDDDSSEGFHKVEILKGGEDPFGLVSTLLGLTGYNYSEHVEIPVYQSQKKDFKLIIKADFLLKVKERDAIITLTDLGPEVTSFLNEHEFLILSLATEKKPLAMVSKILEFIGVECDPGPHTFVATESDDSRNIVLTLPGNVFLDLQGRSILATSLILPDAVSGFLSQRGFKVLALSFS